MSILQVETYIDLRTEQTYFILHVYSYQTEERISIKIRYSSLYEFHLQLIRHLPKQVQNRIPPFPEKAFFNKKAAFIEKRRRALASYLRTIIKLNYIQQRMYLLRPIGLDKIDITSTNVLKDQPKKKVSPNIMIGRRTKIKNPSPSKEQSPIPSSNNNSYSNYNEISIHDSAESQKNKFMENFSAFSKRTTSTMIDYRKLGDYNLEWKFSDCPFTDSSIHIASLDLPYQKSGEKFLIKVQYFHKCQLNNLNILRQEYDSLLKLKEIEGVPEVIDFYIGQESQAIIMKAFPQSASSLVDLQFPLSLIDFLTIAVSILETLSKVHAKGLSQGSLYPGNIWYDSATKVTYILDFSYCDTEISNVNNYPYPILPYLAPERVNQNTSQTLPTCQSSDLYAMGVILFEMITGRLPFDFNDHLQILHAHVAVKPYRADAINNNIPTIVASIIDKLLNKDPYERYITSHGLLRDISHCLSYLIIDSEFHRTSKKKLPRMKLEMNGPITEIPQFPLGLEDITDDFELSNVLYQREAPFAILKNCLSRVEKHGDVQIAIIHGEEGTGKTSLLSQLLSSLSHDTWFCLPLCFDQRKKQTGNMGEYLLSLFSKQGLEVPKIGHQILSRSKQEVDHWRELLRSTLYNEGTILLDCIPSLRELIGQLPPSNIADDPFKRLFSVISKFIKVLAGNGHPLVLAMDNMQWVDSHMLQLFDTLTSLPGLSHILFIILYRDGEVSKKHPLIREIQKCERKSMAISDIQLTNLDKHNVITFISDSLRLFTPSDIEKVEPLADLVYKKTRGNPFFVCKFLRTIYNDGLLRFDSAKHKWTWDLDCIQQSQYTENVISCLTQTIVTLPANQQHILKQAACVGNDFDVFSLTQLLNHQTPVKFEESYVLDQLYQIAEQDLLSLFLDGKKQIFSFPHEQIQNAAYHSLSEEDRKKSHLKIGILWLKEFLHEHRMQADSSSLCPPYRVIYHLNLGRDLIKDRKFQVDLARYNLLTARGMKDGALMLGIPTSEAIQCIHIGIELLSKDKNPWKLHHDLLFELNLLLYIQLKADDDYQKSETIYSDLLAHAKTTLEKINTFIARVDKLINRNSVPEAIHCLAESLKLLNIDISINIHPTFDDIRALHKKVHELMEGRDVLSLMYKPGKLVLPEIKPVVESNEINNKKNNRRSIIGLDRKTYLEQNKQQEKKNNDHDQHINNNNNNNNNNNHLDFHGEDGDDKNNNIIIIEVKNEKKMVKNNEGDNDGDDNDDNSDNNKRSGGIDLRQTLNFGGNNSNNNSHIISQIMGGNINSNQGDSSSEIVVNSGNADIEGTLLKEQIGIQKLLSKCVLPSYMVSPIMNLQISFIMMILSIKWGFSEYSLIPITFYSLGCIHTFQKVKEGIEYAHLLLRMGAELFPTQCYFTQHLYSDWLKIWENKFLASDHEEREVWESFRHCIRLGDVRNALLVLLYMANLQMSIGEPLDICKEKCTRYYVFMRRIVHDHIDLTLEGYLRIIYLLMDTPFSINNIIPEEEFEEIKIPLMDLSIASTDLSQRVENQPFVSIKVTYYIQQLEYYYLMGSSRDAESFLKKAESSLIALYGQHLTFTILFYGILIRCQMIDTFNNNNNNNNNEGNNNQQQQQQQHGSLNQLNVLNNQNNNNNNNININNNNEKEENSEKRQTLMTEIHALLNSVYFWEEHSSSNYGNRVALAQAEYHRATNRHEEACDYYRKAIQLSKASSTIHYEGLSHELFGECLLQMGKKASCRTELLEALRCYKAWGATAKEKQMEEHYRNIWQFAPISQKQPLPNPSNFIYDNQLIADTFNILQNGVSIGGMLKTTMQHIFRYSGAQTGCLIIETQGALTVEIESKGVDEFQVLHSEPLSGSKYCMGVINYVNTVRNMIVLSNAATDATFMRDPYVQLNQTRSILCVPLLVYTQLVAILYLENSSVTGVFSKANIPLLSTICMQMVQCVNNHRLNDKVQKYIPTFNHSSEDKDLLKKGVLYKKVDKLLGHGWEYCYGVLSYEGLILYTSKKLNKIHDRISIHSIQRVTTLSPQSASIFIRPPFQHFLRLILSVNTTTTHRLYFSVPSASEAADWEKEISSLLPPTQQVGSSQVRLRDFGNVQIREDEITFGRPLGRGAFSTVYLCTWNGVKVAVKSFEDREEDDENEFVKELTILKTLRHPNILLFLGAFSGSMGNCIVTEYMSEGSLFDILHEKSRVITESQKIQLAKDIANGMLYLHSFQPPIIHRDLKSPNVLVDESGAAKVADFGVARVKADKNMTTKQGTVAWMAPEVFEGQVYTELADVYSYGIILWEIWSREELYPHLQFQTAIGMAVVKDKLRPPIPEDCPKAWCSLMVQCWSHSPNLRPSFRQIVQYIDNEFSH